MNEEIDSVFIRYALRFLDNVQDDQMDASGLLSSLRVWLWNTAYDANGWTNVNNIVAEWIQQEY